MHSSKDDFYLDNAYWHRDVLPLGFYEGAQSIAILPNVVPRPWVVIEHELSHVNLVRRSSLGLLQTLISATDGLHRADNRDAKLEESGRFQAKMLRYTVDVHEAVAWFCTELLTEKSDRLLAPAQFREGVSRLHQALRAFREGPDEKPEVEVIDIAEAIGMAALSPNWMRDIFKTLDSRFIASGSDSLFAKRETPWVRFCRLCKIVAASSPPQVTEWTKWVCALRPKEEHMPPLVKPKLMLFGDPTKHSLHLDSTMNGSDLISTLRRLSGTDLGDDDVQYHWDVHRFFNLFDFEIDRYSQVEIVARPKWTTRYDVSGPAGEELLKNQPALIVELDMQQGLRRPTGLDMDTVFIHNYSGSEDKLFVLKTNRSGARNLLRQYSLRGGVILTTSFGYDFGRGDFVGDSVLKDLPHGVVCSVCFRTLWFRLAILSPHGLAGSKEIEYLALASQSAPEDFGFLAFKPANKNFPILMMPSLVSDLERTVSVSNKKTSPFGTKLLFSRTPAQRWAGPARPYVEAVLEAADLNWRQPALMWEKLFRNPELYGIDLFRWRMPQNAFETLNEERERASQVKNAT
jgi:hypothetical protein